MSTYILRRNAQPIRKRGLADKISQATRPALQLWENSKWLQSPPKEFIEERKNLIKEFSWAQIIGYHAGKLLAGAMCGWRKPLPKIGFLTEREKAMIVGFLPTLMVLLALVSLIFPPRESMGMSINQTDQAAVFAETVITGPANWLDGTPRSSGSHRAVKNAYKYATEAGYTFITDDAMLDEAIATGELVKIEGPYIRLVDVDHPYVIPVVRDFANRLGQQYAEQGCGKLVVTSGLRTLEQQATLSNGSRHSVHPTGMSVDLRRADNGETGSDVCLDWLGRTLLSIEGNRRIDVTFENRPDPHFHVVVVPHVYAAWLESREEELDPEVKWLATGLYFEGAFNESMEGFRAIGWSIRNRARSEEFPNTILEVVAEGAAGRSSGGCQFSFMCDGKVERFETLCAEPNAIMSQFWRNRCEERWEAVVDIAEQIIAEPQSADPTGGAVLYYAASMDEAPYWARSDMKRGTVRRLGSHIFACSVHRGDDACRS